MASKSAGPGGGASIPSERAAPWYMSGEDIDNSPSRAFFVKKYGSVEKARSREQECRLTTCAFLQESGQKLRLPQLSIATAIVFYHRFYARESYENYERFQVATTCLFLASKVEETPKKLRDVIVETYKVQHSTVQPPESDQELWRLKEQVLICERELLRVLGFDLSVEHAYRPLLAYVKSISGPRDLAQIAWNFINDSLRTTVCLQYAPRCLAAASAWMASSYLEAKQRPFVLPAHPPGSADGKWYHAFQVREATVRAIVEQIQQMYDENKGGGGGVLLANSGAVERMRMTQQMPAASGSAPPRAPASREASRNGSDAGRAPPGGGSGSGGGGGGGGGYVQREDVKREREEPRKGSSSGGGGGSAAGSGRREEPSAKREAAPPAQPEEGEIGAEEGEIEEGELEAPPSKRSRDDEPK